MDQGIVTFNYSQKLPAGAVAIAQITADPTYAGDLIDTSNQVTAGTLGVWRYSTDGEGPVDPLTGSPYWNAPGLGSTLTISGARTYALDSQFFQITNISTSGVPLFYQHVLTANANSVTILDADGNTVITPYLTQNGTLYHSLDGGLYFVRYVDTYGIARQSLLKYDPVLVAAIDFPTETSYVIQGRLLLVGDASNYWIRFTDYSIFEVSIPYGTLPNLPWFPRVRFPLTAIPPEWAAQSFNPIQPYLLASWVTGSVVSSHVLELQRPNIYPDANHWPDILVFDSSYTIKYALEGTSSDLASRRGTSYPWTRGQIVDVDFHTARVQILGTLDPTDIVFAFYSYVEKDVVFTAIDCNPFTNPAIRNCIVRCYSRSDSDPFRTLYYQVIDYNGNDLSGQTNDPNPITSWTQSDITIIGDLFIGASISPKNLTVTDARVRGGGLVPSQQGIDLAANFWDIGFIDGKPYPIGGTLVVNLPSSILNTMSRSDIEQRVNRVVPMGTLCVLRYYDPTTFEESV